MKDVIEYVARSLVDRPDEVKVRETPRDQDVILELEVAQEDIGKVIGRQGRTARALRVLLAAASGRAGRRIFLEIRE